ncbi:MAG: histidine-type phosphatase [Bifidobacterium psychraerophilum]|uniref:histidine-type phosphatase n=1 Tax=Bifidobacterium psychraerophilum TaxID=218140 RepID=UPI0039EB794D
MQNTRLLTGACAAALIVSGLAASTITTAQASERNTYYSSKQPYTAPGSTAYSAAPAGYQPIYSESVARHGSRGLSSYKYDALLLKMAETASAENGFVSEAAKDSFLSNVNAIIAANVDNGYGMLTGQGADQHYGIGERAYERNKSLFDKAASEGDKIAYQTSGEARATESGENFVKGFNTASKGILATDTVSPLNAAGSGAAAIFDKTPDTLYFHKSANPDGTQKSGKAAEVADAYQDFVDNSTTIANAEDYIEGLPRSQSAATDLLSGIFTTDFISSIGTDSDHRWYNTTDGKKHDKSETQYLNCAANADPQQDEDACGDMGKSIKTSVDAAMDLYNLYIIAADMTNENNSAHSFDFDSYFEGHEADAEWFAYILDSEDFYEKGPSYSGQNETYSIAQSLLDDFFTSIDKRASGGGTVATFRFAHAETIMPFAALLKLPGSTTQAPAVEQPQSEDQVFNYANNPWRGESVTPMAANVQWDVYSKSGTDPKTSQAYTPIVRMLYNEQEIQFNASCKPVASGSTWYKESELKRCLSGIATSEDPTIVQTSGSGNSGTTNGSSSSAQAGDRTKSTASATDAASSDGGKTSSQAGNASAGTDSLAETGTSTLLPFSLALLLSLTGAGVLILISKRHQEEGGHPGSH